MTDENQIRAGKRTVNLSKLIDEGMRIWQGVSDANLSTYASSSAYFFFTSLIPVVIVVACIVSHTGVTEQDLEMLVSAVVPEVFEEFVSGVVSEAYSNAGTAAWQPSRCSCSGCTESSSSCWREGCSIAF